MKTETKDKIMDFIVDVIMMGLLFALLFSIAEVFYIMLRPIKRLFI